MLGDSASRLSMNFQCEGRCRAHQLHIRIRRVNLAALGDRVIGRRGSGLAHDTTGEQVDEDDAEERPTQVRRHPPVRLDVPMQKATRRCRRPSPRERRRRDAVHWRRRVLGTDSIHEAP